MLLRREHIQYPILGPTFETMLNNNVNKRGFRTLWVPFPPLFAILGFSPHLKHIRVKRTCFVVHVPNPNSFTKFDEAQTFSNSHFQSKSLSSFLAELFKLPQNPFILKDNFFLVLHYLHSACLFSSKFAFQNGIGDSLLRIFFDAK